MRNPFLFFKNAPGVLNWRAGLLIRQDSATVKVNPSKSNWLLNTHSTVPLLLGLRMGKIKSNQTKSRFRFFLIPARPPGSWRTWAASLASGILLRYNTPFVYFKGLVIKALSSSHL